MTVSFSLSDRMIHLLHFLNTLGFSVGQFERSHNSSGEQTKAVTQKHDLKSPERSSTSEEPLTWIGGYSEQRDHLFWFGRKWTWL